MHSATPTRSNNGNDLIFETSYIAISALCRDETMQMKTKKKRKQTKNELKFVNRMNKEGEKNAPKIK